MAMPCYSTGMEIRCGKCKGRHGSVNDVRVCYRAETPSDGANRMADTIVKNLTAEPAAEGVYRVHGKRIFRVVSNRTSGHRVAEELIGGKFVYAKGWVYRLRDSERMSLEDAKKYGRETGTCVRCGITLTNPASVEAGIGPICATKV